jgi:hypothetical protein
MRSTPKITTSANCYYDEGAVTHDIDEIADAQVRAFLRRLGIDEDDEDRAREVVRDLMSLEPETIRWLGVHHSDVRNWSHWIAQSIVWVALAAVAVTVVRELQDIAHSGWHLFFGGKGE